MNSGDSLPNHYRWLPTLIVVSVLALGGCGGGEGQIGNPDDDVIELGQPPTHNWPRQQTCPTSLSALCSGADIVLVGTVNLERESVITAVMFGTDAHIICRWPLSDPGSCKRIGATGAAVRGEAAIYGVPN